MKRDPRGIDRDFIELSQSFLNSSTVKSIDIARTVELFDQSSVDKVSWVGGLRRGDLVGEFGENHFEAVESRVGFSVHEAAAQDLVGIVQIPFLLHRWRAAVLYKHDVFFRIEPQLCQ